MTYFHCHINYLAQTDGHIYIPPVLFSNASGLTHIPGALSDALTTGSPRTIQRRITMRRYRSPTSRHTGPWPIQRRITMRRHPSPPPRHRPTSPRHPVIAWPSAPPCGGKARPCHRITSADGRAILLCRSAIIVIQVETVRPSGLT